MIRDFVQKQAALRRSNAAGERRDSSGQLLCYYCGDPLSREKHMDHVFPRRIPDLLQTPAAVRFVSIEPMLGPVHWLTKDNDAARNRVIGEGTPHEWRPTGSISTASTGSS